MLKIFKQYAKCRKDFANYFEYLVLGKLLRIRESQGKLFIIYLLGKVLEVAGKVLPIIFKSGKAFKNSGKGFSPKIPWERKGKGKVSVLPPDLTFHNRYSHNSHLLDHLVFEPNLLRLWQVCFWFFDPWKPDLREMFHPQISRKDNCS